MPRQRLAYSLPPLRAALANFAGFNDHDNKTNIIVRELRQAATQGRTQRPQPFYPLREAATFFGVAVSLVGRAYERLEAEGLLIRKRGAMTLLTPLRPQSPSSTRGVIAIPFWIPGFLMFRDWRQFIIHLEEEIRRHGFVASLIFYGATDEMYPAFAYRVLQHKPDALIWFQPIHSHQPVVEMVAETGVQVLTIHANRYLPFRGGKCVIDYVRPFRAAVTQWREAGIRRVILPRHSAEQSTRITAEAEAQWRQAGFPCVLADANGANLARFLNRLPRQSDTMIAIIEDLFLSQLCTEAPQAVANLLRQARVLVSHPINLPPVYLQGARVDLHSFDTRRAAQVVARNIHTGRAFAATKPLLIPSQVQMQVDAAELARHFGVA